MWPGLFLLGFGLVQFPRQLWRNANVQGAQLALHHRAGVHAERANLAYKECAKALALTRKVSDMFTRRDPMRPYMDRILAIATEQGNLAPLLFALRWGAGHILVFEDTTMRMLRERPVLQAWFIFSNFCASCHRARAFGQELS